MHTICRVGKEQSTIRGSASLNNVADREVAEVVEFSITCTGKMAGAKWQEAENKIIHKR